MAETRRQVVVTGLGVVSPLGSDIHAFWRALCAGQDAVAPITLFDTAGYRTNIAQTVCGVDRGPGDPAVAFALHAAEQALSQAGLDGPERAKCGLAVATTAAGWTQTERLFEAHLTRDDAAFENLLAHPGDLLKEGVLEALASRFGLEGPCALVSPACAAASSAIAWAAQRIRDGDADVMLAGATDALTEVVFAGFHAMRLLANDACRPFSAGRRGLVLSEGAAVLVLEDATHARNRGATPLARLSGWGLSCDAAHPTTPVSDGSLRAMTAALDDAGLQPGDVDQVSAHGTGSAANDAAEAEAIGRLLGPRLADVPVTAIKGTLGHTEGAAGAFAALAAVLSLQHDTLPPLTGYAGPDAALPPLRLATDGAQTYRGNNVLVNASGFGGANASLLFEKPDAPPRSDTRRTTPPNRPRSRHSHNRPHSPRRHPDRSRKRRSTGPAAAPCPSTASPAWWWPPRSASSARPAPTARTQPPRWCWARPTARRRATRASGPPSPRTAPAASTPTTLRSAPSTPRAQRPPAPTASAAPTSSSSGPLRAP